ncbi:uncharacterized protein LOC141586122 [Silene latifolia]|uniref:uncharacterized protein LOC141586122 n=1 Tax=Silene latifolia TaxID=37657 RepID=UPI003D788DEB
MDCPPDWDLLAVVRSCTSTSSAATTTLSPPPPQQPPGVLLEYSAPLTTTNTTTFSTGGWQELHEICQPTTYNNNMSSSLQLLSFSCLSSPSPSPSSSSSLMAAVQNNHIRPSFSCISSSPSSSSLMAAVQNNHIRPSFSCISSSPSPSSSSLMAAVQNNHIRPSSHVIFGASSPSVVVSSNPGGGSGGGGAISHSQRAKKRKNLMKKVCHVPAEGLSSDMWAWRKYGQKPIKGSPYPRGYYRCSSSKGCLARKQVERNRTDPKMFIVTYTSEHNHPMPTHRNSLAGSTRQKPVNATETPAEQPSCSSPSTAGLSPLTERSEVKAEGDEDMSGIFDLMVNDDFYVGFEQLDGGSDDSDCFSEQFSPSSEFPWLSNGSSTSTATAAGGS